MLRGAFQQGASAALERFGVKHAMMMPPVAESVFSRPSVAGAAGAFGRGMKTVGKGLGLGALGLAGAGALALHHQNQEDRAKLPLVYAPLSGSFQG